MSNGLKTTIDKAQVTSLCADAISELERAARLFPTWPIKLIDSSLDYIHFELGIIREKNEENSEQTTGTTIFTEEYFEFVEAAMKPGNQVAARQELVQALAMLLRIGCHLNDYVAKEVQS